MKTVMITCFKQDGCPAHFHNDVQDYLNINLPQRWIGRFGQDDVTLICWPPRSPDLTSQQTKMEGGQSGTYLRLTRAPSGPQVSVIKTHRDETKRK